MGSSLTRTSVLLCRQTSHLLSSFEGIRTRKRRWTLQMELFQSLTPRLRSVGEFMKTVNDNTIP